jgi:hypothetical protein
MDLKDIAKGLADIGLPLLGAALPVPGGMALGAALASAVDDHLGTAAKGQPTVTLDNLVDTLTANAQAKEAALEFQARHAETILQIRAKAEQDAFDTEVKDRTDARGMQVNTRSFMPAVLSTIVVAGFLGILVAMMLGVLKTSDSQALLLLLGSLSTAFGVVMAFWFGTTHQSGRTTELLAQSTPPPKE